MPLRPARFLPGLLALCASVACADAAVRAFDIPPGPLGTTLSRLAAEAGILFAVDARLTEGRTSPGLRARATLEEAFARALRGTDLELAQEAGRFTLRRRSAPSSAMAPVAPLAPESVLPVVRVRALPETSSYASPQAQSPARTDAALLDLPQSVTVLPQSVLQDQAPGSIADALRYVPGIGAAQGEGNRDTPVFRGTASTSDFLIDGIRDDVQYYRDLYNIERVEALRGPNAMAVGHGAVGGLINRVSKEPGWQDHRTLSLQFGSWQQRRATLDWDQRLDEQVAGRLNGMYEASRSYRQAFYLRRFGINPVLAWKASTDALISFGVEHFQDERTADRGVPSWQGRPLPTDPSAYFGNPTLSTTSLRLNAFSFQLDLDLGGGRSLRHRTRYADYGKFFQNAFAGPVRQNADSGALEVALLAHNSRMHRRNAFSQTDISLPFEQDNGIRHTLLLGLELGRQDGDNRRETGTFDSTGSTTLYVPVNAALTHEAISFRTSATDPDNSSLGHIAAAYVQDRLRLSSHWSAIVGLRFDSLRFDVQDRSLRQSLLSRDRLWSPRLGISYQPRDTLSAYANYSIGYMPRAGEQLNLLTPANQALKPERFVNLEAGLKWTPAPGLDFNAAVYQLERHDVAVTDPQNPTLVLALVDGQRTRGLELGLNGRIAAGWDTMAAYTWQDSRVVASISPAAQVGARMPHVPRQALALWNRWSLPDSAWAVGLGTTLRGSVFTSTDNTVRLPGYGRLDAALFHTPQPGLRWQLNVENLLDRRYAAFAHNNNNITPSSPLALKLSVRADF